MTNLDFIVAKVRGMRGKLHEGARLMPLCSQPTLRDLAAALAPDQPIGDALGLQRHLTAEHVASLHHLFRVLDGWEADVFLAILRRYQAENLKVILRCWTAKSDEPTLAAVTVDLPPPLALPARQLMSAPDLETLIDRVPVPSLREGALLGLGEYEESGRLFFVEAGIDRACFGRLHEAASRGPRSAGDAVLELVALELDIYNVMLVLRGVFSYGLNFNKLRAVLAPFGRRVGASELDTLRHADGLDEAAALVPVALAGPGEEPRSAEELEAAMWRNLYRIANRRYYELVLDFGAVVAFAYIKRIELRNLIAISEHVRHGEPGAAIFGKLIRLAKPVAEAV